jgi:hypothetical protein
VTARLQTMHCELRFEAGAERVARPRRTGSLEATAWRDNGPSRSADRAGAARAALEATHEALELHRALAMRQMRSSRPREALAQPGQRVEQDLDQTMAMNAIVRPSGETDKLRFARVSVESTVRRPPEVTTTVVDSVARA